ncbi:hypothetical protein BAUCODRAFT_124955 [Baudoinia panamericana UAMH 10762]|uniref:AA1-like domain-containing protein n=1 Tax=Baudoinia panamericana (strain UAMH 10762) TaxID=717646 RepID=M2MRW4_BAUPA|nr:uncharacterized protein BAUCODRAFT_124955 [Baudoinia panamericana UAMH 10762]EMC94238.1 hypothetical protein BAUCODRAFT_124955 [Baudoinia panamericana UAMH 10762]
MLIIALITALLASTNALPHPQTTGGGSPPPFPPNTTISYYQGSVTDNHCYMSVGSGIVLLEVCTVLKWSGVRIPHLPGNDCSFTVYHGSNTCDTLSGEVTTWQIPAAGNGSVCVDAGVTDGGLREKASGVWACR